MLSQAEERIAQLEETILHCLDLYENDPADLQAMNNIVGEVFEQLEAAVGLNNERLHSSPAARIRAKNWRQAAQVAASESTSPATSQS